MLSNEDFVFDPSKLPPEKPEALWLLRRRLNFDMKTQHADCPECLGTGSVNDDFNDPLICPCCDGNKTVHDAVLRTHYFHVLTKYKEEEAEWRRYVSILLGIKKKLTHREQRFLGLIGYRPRLPKRKKEFGVGKGHGLKRGKNR